MEKPADTKYPILDVLKRRWSPRAFADRPIEPQKIKRLFEAARWAASSFNEQPWRFIVATKHDQPEEFERILGCLVEKNRMWAQGAPMIGLTLSRTTFSKNDKENRVHRHDVGLCMGNFTVQAMAMDLFVHQMAGIEPDKVMQTFNVPDVFEPMAGFAVGYGGEPGQLPEEFRDAETASRDRKDFGEFVFTGEFGNPSPLVRD